MRRSNKQGKLSMKHLTVSRHNLIIAVVLLAFGTIGTILLVSSHAATSTANYEAESGTRSGSASIVSDSGASGSSAVKFAAASGVPNPLKIMPLGDSLTRGAVDLNAANQYNAVTINGYRLQLWNLLTAAGYNIDYVGSITKYGDASLPDHDEQATSGICIKTAASTCNGLTPMYPQTAGWLTTYQPDLVIMQGGGNDWTDSTMTNAKNESYLEQWIQLVWATLPNAKIIVSGQSQWRPDVEALNKAYVQGLQAQGKPIRFLPYADTIGVEANTIDDTHPNTAGYTMWGNQLAPLVEQLFPR